MKKFFAIAAMAAMLIACDGEKPENKPQGGGNNNDEPEYVDPIKADGDFADWDALDASKVAVCELPAGTVKYDGLDKVKVYADENYLNVYFEFKKDLTDGDWVAFHIYLNTDNDETTGGGDDDRTPNCSDWMMEGVFLDGGAYVNFDPALFPWASWAPAGEPGWNWTVLDEGVEGTSENNWGAYAAEGSGIASGMGSGNAYELKVIRALIPNFDGDVFTAGFDFADNWTTVGSLPCVEATDENPNGATSQLVVTTDK